MCIYILDIEPLDSKISLIFYEQIFKSPHQTLKIYFSFLKYGLDIVPCLVHAR